MSHPYYRMPQRSNVGATATPAGLISAMTPLMVGDPNIRNALQQAANAANYSRAIMFWNQARNYYDPNARAIMFWNQAYPGSVDPNAQAIMFWNQAYGARVPAQPAPTPVQPAAQPGVSGAFPAAISPWVSPAAQRGIMFWNQPTMDRWSPR